MHLSTQPMAICPFNSAHKFAKEKFIFHISRCKDKEKVIHLYTKCQYNPFHYILKEDIELHECCCSSKGESIELVEKLKKTYRQSIREPRERSRERANNSLEVKNEDEHWEEKLVKEEDCEALTLEKCDFCQLVLKNHKDKILKGKDEKLKRFILKYYELLNEEV